MSQRQLAQAAGIDHATISRLEHGLRRPLLSHLEALAVALRCSPRDFIPPRAA